MLNKLRLFIKEYMNAILSGIGGIIMGFAFASFVEANQKSATNSTFFYWLSLLLFIVAISLWIIAVFRQWKTEKEEKIEHKRQYEAEMRALERFIEANTSDNPSGRYMTNPPDKPKENKDAKT